MIQEIIERYELNKRLRIHDRIWITDSNFLKQIVNSILQIQGEIGILIKFALFSGLRGEEINYVFNTEICNNLSGCNCSNLHVIDNKNNGYSVIVINRTVSQKHSYFSIVPTSLWNKFRTNLSKVDYEDRKIAHAIIKNHTNNQTSFMDLRKFHYNVLCRTGMK